MSKKKCSVCFSDMCKEDNFCVRCGGKPSRRLFPRMLAKQDRANYKIAVIYGPPVNFLFKCEKCGKEWEMFMKRSSFCPQCGAESVGFENGSDK